MKRLSVLIFPAVILMFAMLTTSITSPQGPVQTASKPKPQPLPTVGSPANLKTLLGQAYKSMSQRRTNVTFGQVTSDIVSAAPRDAAKSIAESAAPDYSKTNVQVEGVDEADLVKTDGEYIYQVNDRKVIILRAYPADKMEIVKTIVFSDQNFTPRELYIDDRRLVVVGDTYYSSPVPEPKAPAATKPDSLRPEIYPPIHVQNTVKTIIFDTTDKHNIKQVRETELEGAYVSSRKIGPAIYLIANRYIDYYYIEQEAPPTPSYRDSAGTGKMVSIDCQQIRYFPGSVEPNYLLIAGLNLDNPSQEMQVSTYLGAGQNIYSSPQNLYVTIAQAQEGYEILGQEKQASAKMIRRPDPAQTNTAIYKFSLTAGQTDYMGRGEVPGTILNQFSMDEYKDSFRIATTSGDVWRTDEYKAQNNVYVLDDNLKITGKIEGVAPGERIYSVRFLGGRGYMVTFKKVDPLFVLDLNDPKAPKILGSLKIPGYSDYLHPYDENHIIGFGKEAVEMPEKDWGGRETGNTIAFYQGMKIAVFDVTDVANPVEQFKEVIGDRGTDSNLLYDHKALLFSKNKALLAFPVRVMEVKDKSPAINGMPRYGEFSFQGAYVYSLDLKSGFKLRGKITHTDRNQRPGDYWMEVDPRSDVQRIMYIGDTLYTISNAMVKANDLRNLREIKSLKLS